MTADAVVAAGRDLTLQASANAAGGHSVSRIDAGGDLALVAGRDLTLQASQLTAGDNVVLQAGQDLRLETLADTRLFDSRRSSGSTTTHQVADIRAGGDAALSAGRDALLQGSHVDAEGALALVAGRDIDIQAVVDERSVESHGAVRRGSYQRSQFDQTVRGAELTAGSDIAIVGGRDVTLEAAYVGSDAGGVAIGAGRDLSLIAAEEQHNFEQTTQTKKSGLFSSKRTTTYDRVDETLAVGTTISGETIQLSAGNDLTVAGSVALADGDVRIAAGNNVTIESAQDTLYEAHSSSQKRSGFSGGFSGGVASVGYGKSSSSTQNTLAATTQVGSAVGSLDGNLIISAGNQLAIAASDLAAGQNLTLAAKDILLEARQDTADSRGTQSSKSSGYSLGITYDPAAAYRSARDNATGSDPGSGSTMGELTRTADGMAAGSKAALTPVVVRGGSQRASGAWGDSTSDARVSQLAAGGNLTLLASDGSITSQGAQMSAEGDAVLLASRNIVFDVAHNTESRGQDSARTGWSMDNSATLPVGMNRQQGDGTGYSDTITGTQLSVGGNAVLRTTEGDIALTGSNIVAEGNVDLHAAGDLSIRSGQDTAGNANRSDDKAIGTVVISDTERFAGYHTERYNGEGTQVSQVASSVGSLGGDVRMSAGGAYTQQASHVVAAGDVDITAATIDITTADDINSGSQQNKDFKFGVFARVNSPLIALVNNVDAARQSDGRLQAMQGMAAANAYQTASAISSMAGGAGSGSLVSAEAGVGVATSQNQSQFNERLSQGSTISGGGNVSLTTTEGDLRITQGNLTAGNTLSLDSAKDLILEAGQSQVSDQSKGSNAGVEVGVGVAVGAQTGVYVYAQANVGSHRNNSDSTTYQNTQLAGQAINLTSQGDTTLRGATATAETINVSTVGDLTIESLQDIAQSQSKDSNVGGRVQVSFGSAWSASGYASQNEMGSNYRSVTQQSGLLAGDGGFQIDVGGTTSLTGAVIASTADPRRNRLSTDHLEVNNLQNEADAKANSINVIASNDMLSGSKYGAAKGTALNLMSSAHDQEGRSSVTRSDIAAGTVEIRSGDPSVLDGLERTATDLKGAAALAQIDLEKLRTNVEVELFVKQLVYNEAVKLTDEAYRAMFLEEAVVYEVVHDEDGNRSSRELSADEKLNLKRAADGKVHVANNGIFNALPGAEQYADQHSSAEGGPQYFIHFPQAKGLSELLVAGYQKYLENEFWGLTNATWELLPIMTQYGQSGLHLDGHSRGSMTIGNAMEVLVGREGAQGMLSGTTGSFFGPAYNASEADHLLGFLQNRQEGFDPNMRLHLQNHVADPVGRFIGWNPYTGGVVPEGSTWLKEAARALGGENTSHICYGAANPRCGVMWHNGFGDNSFNKPSSAQEDP